VFDQFIWLQMAVKGCEFIVVEPFNLIGHYGMRTIHKKYVTKGVQQFYCDTKFGDNLLEWYSMGRSHSGGLTRYRKNLAMALRWSTTRLKWPQWPLTESLWLTTGRSHGRCHVPSIPGDWVTCDSHDVICHVVVVYPAHVLRSFSLVDCEHCLLVSRMGIGDACIYLKSLWKTENKENTFLIVIFQEVQSTLCFS
jgi:hypothetical protein